MILNQIFPMEFFMADWTRRVFLAMTQQMILEGCFVAEKFWTLVTAKFVEVALELRIFGWFTRFLRPNKIVKENQDRGWMKDGPRYPKQVSVKSCLLLPLTKFSTFERFFFHSASVNFKAYFDEYFVVKSPWRLSKLLVVNDVSKTGLESKIRKPWTEILAFFWDKVHTHDDFRGFF